MGCDARPSRANVRHPAAAQLPTAYPFVLDGLPGTTPRRPRSVAGRGRAFGACCFAGNLRSPAGPTPVPPSPRWLDPHVIPYVNPYVIPYALAVRTPGFHGEGICAAQPPSGGVERPRRVVRFARLIHRRVRVLGGPLARAASGGSLSLAWWPHRVISRPEPDSSHPGDATTRVLGCAQRAADTVVCRERAGDAIGLEKRDGVRGQSTSEPCLARRGRYAGEERLGD
jgi:hypothetical protein